MNEDLLGRIEREVLSWPGVGKETGGGGPGQGGFWVPRPLSSGSGAITSGTSTTTITDWPTSRSRKSYGQP